MENPILSESTLQQAGISLLPDEKLEVTVRLEDGLTEDLEQRHATLLLTNKRVMRYSLARHRANVVSAALGDITSIEVYTTEKTRQRVWVGLMFIAGGVLLGIISLLMLSSPLSPSLMALSLILIGVVFMLSYISGMTGTVVVRAGLKNIKGKVESKALEDMALLVRRYHELKMGPAGDGVPPEDGSQNQRSIDGDLGTLTSSATKGPELEA